MVIQVLIICSLVFVRCMFLNASIAGRPHSSMMSQLNIKSQHSSFNYSSGNRLPILPIRPVILYSYMLLFNVLMFFFVCFYNLVFLRYFFFLFCLHLLDEVPCSYKRYDSTACHYFKPNLSTMEKVNCQPNKKTATVLSSRSQQLCLKKNSTEL